MATWVKLAAVILVFGKLGGYASNGAETSTVYRDCHSPACKTLEQLYDAVLCGSPSCCIADPTMLHTLAADFSRSVVLFYSVSHSEAAANVAKKLSKCGISSSFVDVGQPDFRAETACPGESLFCFDVDRVATADVTASPRIFDACNCSELIVSNSSENVCTGRALVPAAADATLTNLTDTLARRVLRVATADYPPFVIKNGTRYSGVVFEIMDKLRHTYGFRYETVEPTDHEYGIMLDNGTFNGMVGMLQRQEVDMIAAGLTVTYSRSAAVDFATAYHFEMNAIMINQPRGDVRLWLWLEPFQTVVWAMSVVSVVVSSFLLLSLHKLSNYPMLTRFQHLRACFWYVISCAINQDYDVRPVTWSSMTFLAFWNMGALILAASYSGNLVATLATSRRTIPFQTFEELSWELEKGTYKLCIEGGTTLHEAILNSNYSEYRRARDWLSHNPGYVLKDSECVDKLLNDDRVAYATELTYLSFYQRKYCETHKFVILTDRFLPGYFSLAFQKDSPLMHAFSEALMTLFEDGLVDAWMGNYSRTSDFCRVAEPNSLVRVDMRPLSVSTVGGVFLLLIMGYALAAVWFAVERWRIRSCDGVLDSWHGIRSPRENVGSPELFRVISFIALTTRIRGDDTGDLIKAVNSVRHPRRAYNIKVKTKQDAFSDLSEKEKRNVTLSERSPEWITLLLNIPLSVILLGELLVLSSQKDFSLLENGNNQSVSNVRAAESFRASLVQLSEHSWRAFLTAHTNMHRVREQMPLVPKLVKTLKMALAEGNEKTQNEIVPATFDEIKNLSLRCRTWAGEVETKFGSLAKVLHELLMLLQGKKGLHEADLDRFKLELAASEENAAGQTNMNQFLNEEYEKSKSKIESNRKEYEEKMKKYMNSPMRPDQMPILGPIIQTAGLIKKKVFSWWYTWTGNSDSGEEETYSENLAVKTIEASFNVFKREVQEMIPRLWKCLQKNKINNCNVNLTDTNNSIAVAALPGFVPEQARLYPLYNESKYIEDDLKGLMQRLTFFEPSSLAGNAETNDTLRDLYADFQNISERIIEIQTELKEESYKKGHDDENEGSGNVDLSDDRAVADQQLKMLLKSQQAHGTAYRNMMKSKETLLHTISTISSLNYTLATGAEVLALTKQAAMKLEELKQSWSNVTNLMGYVATKATLLTNMFQVNLETLEVMRQATIDRLGGEEDKEKKEALMEEMKLDKQDVLEKTVEMNKEAYYMYQIARQYVDISEAYVMNRLINLTQLAESKDAETVEALNQDLQLGAMEAQQAIVALAEEHERKFNAAVDEAKKDAEKKKKEGKWKKKGKGIKKGKGKKGKGESKKKEAKEEETKA